MKASEVLEEVFLNCDNCGENFKTTQRLKDHFDQGHHNLTKIKKIQVGPRKLPKHVWKGVKATPKDEAYQFAILKCGTGEKS